MRLILGLASLIFLTSCGGGYYLVIDKPQTCQVIQTDDGATIMCPGQQPVNITDGLPGTNGVIELIDPCGDLAGHPDEVILRLSPTSLVAYFKVNGNKEFLAELQLGVNYVTTDQQACQFTVNLDGTIVDQYGNNF